MPGRAQAFPHRAWEPTEDRSRSSRLAPPPMDFLLPPSGGRAGRQVGRIPRGGVTLSRLANGKRKKLWEEQKAWFICSSRANQGAYQRAPLRAPLARRDPLWRAARRAAIALMMNRRKFTRSPGAVVNVARRTAPADSVARSVAIHAECERVRRGVRAVKCCVIAGTEEQQYS